MALLADTYGIQVVHKVICPVRRYDASTYVTKGKLEELNAAAKEQVANLIIFDDEISPGQQMNLEKVFALPVIDRTEVILGNSCPARTDKRSKAPSRARTSQVRSSPPQKDVERTFLSSMGAAAQEQAAAEWVGFRVGNR